jgi:hypothetical protein
MKSGGNIKQHFGTNKVNSVNHLKKVCGILPKKGKKLNDEEASQQTLLALVNRLKMSSDAGSNSRISQGAIGCKDS